MIGRKFFITKLRKRLVLDLLSKINKTLIISKLDNIKEKYKKKQKLCQYHSKIYKYTTFFCYGLCGFSLYGNLYTLARASCFIATVAYSIHIAENAKIDMLKDHIEELDEIIRKG